MRTQDEAYDDDYIEAIKISDWKPVRARKAHACSHCGGAISIGSIYFRQAWKVEGDMVVTQSHDPYGECVMSS